MRAYEHGFGCAVYGSFFLGLVGTAAATAVSQMLGGLIPILFFCRADAGTLKLTKTKIDGKALLKACTNGSSELMSNISMSIVSILYNFQLMRYAGENGIAGIWFSVVAAELVAAVMTVLFITVKRKKYHY